MMFNFATSEPSWIQMVSALGVPLALAIAIGNAIWQSYLQKRQLKVALFDKRFPVFVTVREFLVEGGKTGAQCAAFLRDTKQGKFLFGRAFDDFVNEVYGKAQRCRQLNELLPDGQRPSERYLEELQSVERWLTEAFAVVEKKFGPDLQLNDAPSFFRLVVASIKSRIRRQTALAKKATAARWAKVRSTAAKKRKA